MTTAKRIRLGIVFLCALFLAQMFVQMGLVKFETDGFWTAAFDRWGYPVWFRIAVGVVEVVGGVAILLPWVASWGAAALTAVMAEAVVTRAFDGWWGDVAWNSLYIAVLIWIGTEWWRWRWHPARQLDRR